MKDKKKQYNIQNNWIRENRSKLTITTTKENALKIKQAARQLDQSINSFILSAVEYYIQSLESDPKRTDTAIIKYNL